MVLLCTLLTQELTSARFCKVEHGQCVNNDVLGRRGRPLACSNIFKGKMCQFRGNHCVCRVNPGNILLQEFEADDDVDDA